MAKTANEWIEEPLTQLYTNSATDTLYLHPTKLDIRQTIIDALGLGYSSGINAGLEVARETLEGAISCP